MIDFDGDDPQDTIPSIGPTDVPVCYDLVDFTPDCYAPDPTHSNEHSIHPDLQGLSFSPSYIPNTNKVSEHPESFHNETTETASFYNETTEIDNEFADNQQSVPVLYNIQNQPADVLINEEEHILPTEPQTTGISNSLKVSSFQYADKGFHKVLSTISQEVNVQYAPELREFQDGEVLLPQEVKMSSEKLNRTPELAKVMVSDVMHSNTNSNVIITQSPVIKSTPLPNNIQEHQYESSYTLMESPHISSMTGSRKVVQLNDHSNNLPIQGQIGGESLPCLIDTGSAVTAIRSANKSSQVYVHPDLEGIDFTPVLVDLSETTERASSNEVSPTHTIHPDLVGIEIIPVFYDDDIVYSAEDETENHCTPSLTYFKQPGNRSKYPPLNTKVNAQMMAWYWRKYERYKFARNFSHHNSKEPTRRHA